MQKKKKFIIAFPPTKKKGKKSCEIPKKSEKLPVGLFGSVANRLHTRLQSVKDKAALFKLNSWVTKAQLYTKKKKQNVTKE